MPPRARIYNKAILGFSQHLTGDFNCARADLVPDETTGYQMLFFIGEVSTMAGQFIVTKDGLSYVGPLGVNFVTVDGSEEHVGSDIMEFSGFEVAPDAWYTFRLKPFDYIIHLTDNPGARARNCEIMLCVRN